MSVTFSVSIGKPARAAVDLVIVPAVAQGKLVSSLPGRLSAAAAAELRALKFTGAWGTAELLPAPRGMKASFVAVVGLGDPASPLERRAEGMRRGVARVVQDARRHALRTAALDLTGLEDVPHMAAVAVEAVDMASYRFSHYSKKQKADQQQRALRRLTLFVEGRQRSAVRQAVTDSRRIMSGVHLTRELVNQPASTMAPETLVEAARTISARSRRISLEVLDRRQAAQAGFHAFLAVARGSSQPPYVIHLTYTPPQATKKIIFVGKGVTFDSGGLSIKPADYMEAMKIDMAGAATVLGLFSVLPSIAPSAEVHGIIAACENMPSGEAYRPGDILTAKNGKTIEVLNTDAEGRITLADALCLAAEQKPDAIVDLATLTGACMVALGDSYAGLWSNDTSLRRGLMAAARRAGEGLAALPLPEEYRPFIESKVADVRNTATSRYGGAITAALFLREFVGNIPWAHLDIAGPVYSERPILPYWPYGATGYGVRTLVEFLRNYHSDKNLIGTKK